MTDTNPILKHVPDDNSDIQISITNVIAAFLNETLTTTIQILVMMMKAVTDDCITQTSSILMNTKVHLAITDIGLLLYSTRPELTIPFHMMTKRQICSVKKLTESMVLSNLYVTGSKMTRGYFAAPTKQALYVVPSHRVLHACVMLLRTQHLPRAVYEFMLHRLVRTCDLPQQIVQQTCELLESDKHNLSQFDITISDNCSSMGHAGRCLPVHHE